MNKNVESYFSLAPVADIQRSTFDLSQDIKLSFNVGEFIPFYCCEVLPGDTFKIETSKVVRLQTLLAPVMDNAYLDTMLFYVPNRLSWSHWKQFMGENSSSAWLPEVTYTVPQIKTGHMYDPDTYTNVGFPVGSFQDYLGVPPGVDLSVNALPFRAVELIWNEWFRSQDLEDPSSDLYTGDADTYLVWSDSDWDKRDKIVKYRVNKYHDMFTSCSPAPLKGDPVLAPVSSSNSLGVPVGGFSKYHEFGNFPLVGKYKTSSQDTGTNVRLSGQAGFPTDLAAEYKTSSVLGSSAGFTVQNLYGDVSSLGINIMQLRNAFQVQRFLEKDLFGTRYTETILNHFGVKSPDARLQRPEYLGGNRIPITIHQIVNQSQGEQDFLGDLGAMSLTTDRHSDVVKSFSEHGYIIGIMCVRYSHSYPQGLERHFSRKTKFDYYWPEFAHLANQPVYNSQIFAQGTDDDNGVFGYNEAWCEYRYAHNRVCAEMRPGVANSLASWHFADYYESLPTLSKAWLNEDRTNVDRTLAVTSVAANSVFCDVYVKVTATRPMPVYSIPGLADHF